ncbi:MAG: ferritin-like domain-containing protein [Myxococcales bacterium]|nr:ferritin-like domain-containing protein [Myxococcales bacterium]MDH5308030.1 ferritin-like domain-containing protein [Myxococcales bacterium]MDH5567140.1 ferritin-like domain-containing protein [Myxococcales bacterium]
MPAQPTTLRDFCRRILERGDLETKLAPLPRALDDSAPGPALHFASPARAPQLALGGGAERLPRPAELHAPAARARCLARFAHHELMAVELFAWALLRWPALPSRLRRVLLRILADEQRHCRLYLERLAAHGSRLEAHPRSDYFWRHAPTIAASPHGPRAFLCAMGLTLEQANLDFAPLYRDAFRAAGDERSAQVCERVHRDEIRHVRHAALWLRRLSGGQSELEAYTEAVPFPFAATRAKGRRFDAAARRSAGLSPEFIEAVRSAGAAPRPARG